MAFPKSVLDDPHYEEGPFDDVVWRAEQERHRLQQEAQTTLHAQTGSTRTRLAQGELIDTKEPHPLDPLY